MVAAFMLINCTLTLYGGFLVYSSVKVTGCDPSGGVNDNKLCDENGASVFGAMLGVVFASLGIPAVSNFVGTFTATRIALYKVMNVIYRNVGKPQEEIFDDPTADDLGASKHCIKAILPQYLIDSSSHKGLKPGNIKGVISFEDVEFYYPTRPKAPILSGLNLKIEAGTTVALVGPSGGGKSTIMALIERFYDPIAGSVKLDGVELKDWNVNYLRSIVAYVGQEPAIFATTITQNILYGNPNATQHDVEEAAKKANAHSFIVSFPDGYETHCGDNGAHLSGGKYFLDGFIPPRMA
jgi:ATP-binding cassette, subfamily B (MDR/TAP), member 1